MRHINRWPAPRGEALPGDETLPEFAETISSDIESTRSQYVDLNLRQGGSRAERELESLRQKLIDAHTKEIADIRHQVAILVQTNNLKASKKALDLFSKALTEKIDKRLDNNRNLVVAAVALISGLLGWIKVKG